MVAVFCSPFLATGKGVKGIGQAVALLQLRLIFCVRPNLTPLPPSHFGKGEYTNGNAYPTHL